MRAHILKKALAALGVLCLLTTAGAGALADGDVFSFLGPEYQEFSEIFDKDFPVAVGYRADTVAGGCESFLWDEDSIRQVFDALSTIQVGKEDLRIATDSDCFFIFLMADGSERCLSFNQRYLAKGGARYEITGGDALWSIPFPCYDSSCSMLDMCAYARADELIDGLDTAPPTAVSFRQGDGQVSRVTDPDFIEQILQAMDYTGITWVEDQSYIDASDFTVSEFEFTMADDGALTITLYDDWMAVDTGVEQLGVRYYLLDGTEQLWSLSFPGYEQIRIEKGIAYGLIELYGEDIRDALSAENRGSLTSLTVTRRAEGQGEETYTFSQEPFEAVSDMAQKIDELGYLEELISTPEGDEVCRFVFTDDAGESWELTFIDGCAAIEQADGTLRYYPVEHGDMDENGIMDLVYREQELLDWKEEVNFQGKSPKPVSIATVLRVALVLLAFAAALGAVVYGVVRLVGRGREKDQTKDRPGDK